MKKDFKGFDSAELCHCFTWDEDVKLIKFIRLSNCATLVIRGHSRINRRMFLLCWKRTASFGYIQFLHFYTFPT